MNSYAISSYPKSFTVLGKRLKNFCLGHYLILERQSCKYVAKELDGIIGIDDLLIGVMVCSRNYEQALEFVDGLEAARQMQMQYKLPSFLGRLTYRLIHRKSKKHKWFVDGVIRLAGLFEYLHIGNKDSFFSEEDKDKAIKVMNEFHTWKNQLVNLSRKDSSFNWITSINQFAHYIKEGSKEPVFYINDELLDSSTPNGGHWSQSIRFTLTGDIGIPESRVMNMPLKQAFYENFKNAEKNSMGQLGDEDEQMEEIKQ